MGISALRLIFFAFAKNRTHEPREGIEPSTSVLPRLRSATELSGRCAAARIRTWVALSGDGFTDRSDCPLRHRSLFWAVRRIRTDNLLFTKQLLCHWARTARKRKISASLAFQFYLKTLLWAMARDVFLYAVDPDRSLSCCYLKI